VILARAFAVAVAVALAWLPALPAAAATRHVLVLNAGNAAILYLRIGSAASSRWSADLLGYAGAIDVGRAEDVAIEVDETACTYDLQAVYDDGTVQIAPGVDLCATDRVSFFQPLPQR
jgi:hypothetical protein